MNKLATRTDTPQNLSAARTAELYALYARYYGGTSPELFARDLAEKDHILLLEDEHGRTRGFTTLKILPFSHEGQTGRALFSGDTIIDHRYWGEQTLPLAWCELAGRLKAQQPDTPLYWLLIVKGDRTYRYLNAFSKNYYPNRRRPLRRTLPPRQRPHPLPRIARPPQKRMAQRKNRRQPRSRLLPQPQPAPRRGRRAGLPHPARARKPALLRPARLSRRTATGRAVNTRPQSAARHTNKVAAPPRVHIECALLEHSL